jgi:hypothetical protein
VRTNQPAIERADPATDRAEHASVLPQLPGIPWWGATVLALVLTLIGVLIDKAGSTEPAWGLRIGYFVGCGLAALAVRRRAVFTAMVQPPLVLVVILVPALKLMFGLTVYESAIKLVNAFPTMAIGTVIAVIIGVVRLFAQPLRHRGSSGPAVRPTVDAARHV